MIAVSLAFSKDKKPVESKYTSMGVSSATITENTPIDEV